MGGRLLVAGGLFPALGTPVEKAIKGDGTGAEEHESEGDEEVEPNALDGGGIDLPDDGEGGEADRNEEGGEKSSQEAEGPTDADGGNEEGGGGGEEMGHGETSCVEGGHPVPGLLLPEEVVGIGSGAQAMAAEKEKSGTES